MGIKLIKKTNEAEHKKFDSSMVAEDEKKFDFTGLHERLEQFRGWLEDLQAKVDVPTPTMGFAASGSSGFCYTIYNGARNPIAVIDLRCGTNPERYPKFEGNIYAGSKRFEVNSIDDLTNKLIDDIVAAVREKA